MNRVPLAFSFSSCRGTPNASRIVGSTRTPNDLAVGNNSRMSSILLGTSSLLKKVTPVALPPGRLIDGTSLSPTGSPPFAKTIGIVCVAACAACTELGQRSGSQLGDALNQPRLEFAERLTAFRQGLGKFAHSEGQYEARF
jgi:hypothetical protein